MERIYLTDIDKTNWEAVCELQPGEEGRHFVASNSFSISQSVYENGWVIKGIMADDELIGFTMYGPGEEGSLYEICRFMIDQRFQGRGYGKRALRVIMEEMLRVYATDTLYISTAPSNARAKHIYQGAGFKPTGEQWGEGDGAEDVLRYDKTN